MMSGNAIQHKTILALLIAGPECIAVLMAGLAEWQLHFSLQVENGM
jgi:hypothetical protein